MPQTATSSAASAWPHRWSVALACATFPLVWVGGLVTTTDAGMAVPDWPSTYGYNLFLYPWQTWLAGPWDIFVEHGHRLLGATVGLITIALLAVLWRSDQRRWMRWLGVAALVLVMFQGALGGMRVLWDERTLAMLHGCTGPLFFALTAAMAVFTSRRWHLGATSPALPGGAGAGYTGHIRALALVTCILVYLQVVLGAVLRHVPIDSEPATFALAVRAHLFLAAILSLHMVALIVLVLRRVRHIRPLAGFACTLAGLLSVQLALGAATWVVKFAAPSWAPTWVALGRAAVQEGGWLQTHIITAHVAVGCLMLATTLALTLYAVRLIGRPLPARAILLGNLEAAL